MFESISIEKKTRMLDEKKTTEKWFPLHNLNNLPEKKKVEEEKR